MWFRIRTTTLAARPGEQHKHIAGKAAAYDPLVGYWR